MSDKNITSIVTPDRHLNLKLSYFDTKKWVEFNGICLKEDKITYIVIEKYQTSFMS